MQNRKETFELENISCEGSIVHPVPKVDMWDLNTTEENEPKLPLQQVFDEGSPQHNQRQVELAVNQSHIEENPYNSACKYLFKNEFNVPYVCLAIELDPKLMRPKQN